jgi:23S rRNA (cytosine1962-C5)-methyltransferase
MGSRKFEGLPETSGVLSGTLSDEEQRALKVRVNGLPFEVDLQGGHKTGLYLDQQVNQQLVAGLAKGARVLDAFCFLGGFALAAARAGAREVVGVDQSAEAVAAASRLASAQGWGDRCRFVTANVFDWLRTEAGPSSPVPASGAVAGAGEREGGAGVTEASLGKFDLIVLDPPSFTRNRAAVEDALRGYKEIHLRSLRLLAPGGVLATFCCSHHVNATLFEGVIQQAAYDARKVLRRVAVYTQGPDHPVLPAVAETEYLKGFAYEVLPA